MRTQASAFDPKRTSLLGAIGFGMGFALLILLRALINPTNESVLTNFGSAWVRETFLFAISGTLGSAFIGLGSQSAQSGKRLALAGGLGCCIAGSLGTLCLYLFWRYGFPDVLYQTAPFWLRYLPQCAVSTFIGAVTGAALGAAQNSRQKIVRLAWVGAAGFGCGHIVCQAVFSFVKNIVWVNIEYSQFWVIPLASSAGLMGFIGGAILGWAMSKDNQVSLETIA